MQKAAPAGQVILRGRVVAADMIFQAALRFLGQEQWALSRKHGARGGVIGRLHKSHQGLGQRRARVRRQSG